MKVLLAKKACNIALKSSKHEEITFPLVFILHFMGVILPKKVQKWEGLEKKKKKEELAIKGGVYRRGFQAFSPL